jgi:putative hemolysin
MTHRKSVVFLPLHSNKAQVKEYMSKELHSVYPVYGDNYDDIVGVVNLKNIFSKIDEEQFNLASIMTDAPFIMEQTTAYKALENFKNSGIHYAFVSDEYGVFQGIITLNDILEALVGDAADFSDEEYQLLAREDGTWLVDGQYSLHDFMTYFDLDDMLNDYEVTTVSGLIITELGSIPKQGEKLIWNKLEFEVIDMDGVKIDKILIKPISE